MKKILFLCLCALFASCSEESKLLEVGTENSLAEELKNVANSYELIIKEYTLDEIMKEKDESPKGEKEETIAEPWMIKAIQDSLNKQILSYGNKTRTDAQPYGGNANNVGVFKYGTCGNYRELVYFMDCEDGGDTHITGSIGSTEVDGNGNVRFRFCLVPPGGYYGGVLLLCDYNWGALDQGRITIIERYHDNQDSNNKNKIEDSGGLAYFGPTNFTANTKFFWIYDNLASTIKLPFTYGVLGSSPAPMGINCLHIDDEDTRNGNTAYISTGPNSRVSLDDFLYNGSYEGIRTGRNTDYYIKRIN